MLGGTLQVSSFQAVELPTHLKAPSSAAQDPALAPVSWVLKAGWGPRGWTGTLQPPCEAPVRSCWGSSLKIFR